MRWRVVVVAVAAALLTVVGWWAYEVSAPADTKPRLVEQLTFVGVVLVVTGCVGIARRPGDPQPIWLAVAGLILGPAYWRLLEPPWAATLGAATWLATPVVLGWAVAGARPDGRTARRAQFAVISLAAATVLASGPRSVGTEVATDWRAASWYLFDPRFGMFWRQANPLALWPHVVVRVFWLAWTVCVLIDGAITLRVARQRRRHGVLLIAVAVSCIASVVLAWPEALHNPTRSSALRDRPYFLPLLAVPMMAAACVAIAAVWGEFVQARLSRTRDGALQLRGESLLASLRGQLERTLGDPTARVVFPDADRWIDGSGRTTALAAATHRAATIITSDGVPVAAIEHDESLRAQPDLVDVAATALAHSLEARRLAAVAGAAAEDARASAARLLAAGDEARRLVEERIYEGPDHDLASIGQLLDVRPLPTEAIHDQVLLTLADVRAIAHGIVPLSLQRAGLAGAIDDLREVSDVAIDVQGIDGTRLPAAVDVTLYLVLADAAANASSPVHAVVTHFTHEVVMRVNSRGSLLDPLIADRVETLGGRIDHHRDEVSVTVPLLDE
jgi:hypothetical protein